MRTLKRTRFLQILAAMACALILTLPQISWAKNLKAKPGKPSAATFEVIVERDVIVPMRDGTKLKADVYRPKAEGKFPVLLERTPYGRQTSTDIGMKSHEFFPPRGYIFIVQDVRGCFGSEGVFKPHYNEREDGYDTVEWIAQQPWSNGKVAITGNSYAGQTVWQAVIAQPPHLTCAFPVETGEDVWRQWYYRGGALEYAFLTHWSVWLGKNLAEKNLTGDALQEKLDEQALFKANRQGYSEKLPLAEFPPAKIKDGLDLFADWASHPTDGPYWWDINIKNLYGEVAIPVMHVAGWYDIFLSGTLNSYLALKERAPVAAAREDQRLVVGPWAHSGATFFHEKFGDVSVAPGIKEKNFHEMRLEFMDYWMKDTITGTLCEKDELTIFTYGDNRWRAEHEWPLARTKYTNFYLNGGKSGSIASLNDGTLAGSAKPGEKPQSYVYDPMNPTPTRGGSTLFCFPYGPDGSGAQGGIDQQVVDKKSLTFTSAPLKEAMEITGPVKAIIYAASSAVDTDWVVRVNDVAPDGTAINIVDGITRARFRQSGVNPTLIEPGKVYEYSVDLHATSYVFKPGHRIRVVVNSSSFPRWSRNLNVAELPERAKEWTKATNTIYLDAEHPSHVILPVIPR